MENNTLVAMLDEEIARLRQVRTIMETLVREEAQTASLLVAAAAEPEPERLPVPQEVAAAVPEVVRHVSRRGIATGRRGPRIARQVPQAPPRPLDSAVPRTPVVVSRSALLAAKPVLVAPPPPPAEGTLEAWVRSLKQASPAA